MDKRVLSVACPAFNDVYTVNDANCIVGSYCHSFYGQEVCHHKVQADTGKRLLIRRVRHGYDEIKPVCGYFEFERYLRPFKFQKAPFECVGRCVFGRGKGVGKTECRQDNGNYWPEFQYGEWIDASGNGSNGFFLSTTKGLAE